MDHWSIGSIVLVAAVSIFTAVAAVWDFKYWRIPNALTLPMFAAGWLYQGLFYGGPGLLNGLGAFAIGFGVLFVLWMVGGGGGGDVKLMGAISVWMGYRLTLWLLIISTILVVLMSVGTVLWNVITRGTRDTRRRFTAAGKTGTVAKPIHETVQDRQKRRVLGYAVPVCLGAWMVLGWFVPKMERQLRAQEQAPPVAPVEAVIQPISAPLVQQPAVAATVENTVPTAPADTQLAPATPAQ